LANSKEDYTLAGFIESFNNIKNQLTNQLKIINMESPIIPLGDKIVILPQEEGRTKYGNIIVPDMGKEKPEMGKVLAVGPGRISTDGTLIPNRIRSRCYSNGT
jgi:hypothetical protein